MLWNWELERPYAFQVLKKPLLHNTRSLKSSFCAQRQHRAHSSQCQPGQSAGGWGGGVEGESLELRLDCLTHRKGHLNGMRGEELFKWLFSLPSLSRGLHSYL